jgi:vacuolar-type H+-ATPase subunit H
MVIQTAVEYINEALSDRVKYLQNALNQAETIIHKLEIENQNLKEMLTHLEQENLLEV